MDETTPAPALDDRFQALSDGKRLRILELLRDGEQCVCELTDALGVGQSLLSFHLKTLREAGLVRARRDGRWVHYSLEAGGLEALRRQLDRLVESARAAEAEESEDGAQEVVVPRCC